VSVGERTALRLTRGADGGTEIQTLVEELVCTRVKLNPAAATPATAAAQPDQPAEVLELPAEPLDRPPAAWAGTRQVMQLPEAAFGAAFPRLCAHWGSGRVAAIALLSTYVGMICPGMHSVFASLELEPGEPATGPLTFTVGRYDPRFKLFSVDFSGPVRGRLRAFQRPPRQEQAPMASLLPMLPAQRWRGRSAWVLGGSRGLGELAAKLAAAGGADVALTYATGQADAQRVVADIDEAGRGSAAAWALDVMHEDWTRWLEGKPLPDALLYFASPRIFRKKAALLDADQLQEFMDCYVHRFAALCLALEARAERPITVFVPSTVFIDERPRGMTEYAMAKSAAEVLAADLGRSLQWLRFAVHRLPKLATDQTATVMGARTASNVEVLLPLVASVLEADAPPAG